MKKITKRFSLFMATILVISMLAGCGGSGGGSVKTKPVTGEVVKVEIPSGWSLVTSTEMNGASGADFICHSEKFEIGDAYLQAVPDSRDIEEIEELLESTDPYGAYSGEVELENGKWYVAEKAAAAVIDEKTIMVLSYEVDFNTDEAKAILGSMQWA